MPSALVSILRINNNYPVKIQNINNKIPIKYLFCKLIFLNWYTYDYANENYQ